MSTTASTSLASDFFVEDFVRDLVLIPVDHQHDALVNLADPLAIVARLEQTFGVNVIVRVIPMGVDYGRVEAIRERIATLRPHDVPRNCQIMPRIRDLRNKTNLARKRRKYIWEYSGCKDLESYYRNLTVA